MQHPTWLPLILVMAAPSATYAQPAPEPLPVLVVDLRGFYTGLGQDPVTASGLGLPSSFLPSRALGGVLGLHAYPLRLGNITLGLGGEFILARGRRIPKDADGMVIGLPAEQRLRGLSGSLSLNFGHRNGWSYVTAGMGPMSFGSFVGEAAPAEPAPEKSTINLGGGARWFALNHMAVTFDVRFYLTRPDVATPSYPARQRNRLLILSAGIAIK